MVDKLSSLDSASVGAERELVKSQGIALKAKNATTPEAQEKAGQEFEALLINQMMKSMWSAIPNNGMLSGSREEEYYRDMLNEAIAKDVSEGQGIGIKQVILKELKNK